MDISKENGAGSTGADPGLGRLLSAIFEGWNKSAIAYLVLRNYEDLPDSTGNDVDILVGPRDVRRAEEIMIAAAGECGFVMHNRVEFATLSCFFHHPGSLRQIQIDLFSRLSVHSFEMIAAGRVLAERQARGDFFIPHPAHEAVIDLLTRLLYEGKIKEKYRAVITKGLREAPELAAAELAEVFGAPIASSLFKKAQEQQWSEIEGSWRALRRGFIQRRLIRQSFATVGSILRDGMRFLRRAMKPGGIVVAVIGPDGSGKSTVAERAVDQLRNTFNPGKMLQVHWKPVVFFKKKRKPSGKPTVDPHKNPPRNRLASACYLLGHWLEFLAGSHLYFRKATFKNGMVLVDRYHYDFLVDQRRYRLNAPRWLVRVLFTLVKKPDLVLLFDAPAEVLQSRKREVSFAETARQAQAYRELLREIPQGIVLDATRPIDEVTREMTEIILKYLSGRMAKRLKA